MSTGISWTDITWNPVTGCSRVSEGCRNCYAAALAPRLAAMGQKGYTKLPWTAKNAPENVKLHEDRLEKPLRWKKPRRVFVNSMSDLFHEQVPEKFVAQVFAVMALAPRHTFQILTKRPERMSETLSSKSFLSKYFPIAYYKLTESCPDVDRLSWPLPNVWLGTSVENADVLGRVEWLRKTPAAIRFISAEPLLGPLVRSQQQCPKRRQGDGQRCIRPMGHPGDCAVSWGSTVADFGKWPPELSLDGIDWLIAGGESGPNHRQMDKEWARSLRDQCVEAGVPFFYKQASAFRNESDPYLDGEMWRQMPALYEEAVS